MGFPNYMFGRISRIVLFAVMMAMFAVPVSADTLYDNGPINGTINAWGITHGQTISDSFTLSGASTLTGVGGIGVWASPVDIPATVDWSIGTSPGGSEDGSGTASLTGSALGPGSAYGYSGQYSVYSDGFTLSNIPLAGGTYYLTLQNATDIANNGDYLFWDLNNGPSTAYVNGATNLNGYGGQPGTNSNAFAIYGSYGPTGAPEPGTLTLLGTGLLSLMGLGRRRRI